jgi:hypothetical protein
MPSAKQIAWRKKFARMSKAGKFKKSKKRSAKGYSPTTKGLMRGIRKIKKKTELKVSDIGDYMTPIKKPEFFENKDKGKYMILQGTNTQYPMPYRDPFTGRQLVDSLDSVQRIAFLLDAQGEKVQIISS